jgi:hypothetical protein
VTTGSGLRLAERIEKLFKSKDFSLKWYGPKKEKLQIMKDNGEKSLQCALEASAQANGVISQDENMTMTNRMVDVVNKQHRRSEVKCRRKPLGVRKL